MKSRKIIAALTSLLILVTCGHAAITWEWRFSTEIGRFETEGTKVGAMVPAGRYTISVPTLEVTQSIIPGNVGANYAVSQPTIGIYWDGVHVTNFWRGGGVWQNGLSFARTDREYGYSLSVERGVLFDGDEEDIETGLPVVVPYVDLTPMPTQTILWAWTFGPESGTIRTGGSLVDGQVPAGTYTTEVETLRVYDSTLPLNVGASYIDKQPDSGFEWDGTRVWRFWQDGGALTNGASAYRGDYASWYSFAPGEGTLNSTGALPLVSSALAFAPLRVEVVSLTGGLLTWTCNVARAKFHVQWSALLEEGFHSNWNGFSSQIHATGAVMSAQVPMFYRVTFEE